MDVDKNQQQHLRNAMALTLGLIFSVNRTVEIFSKRAGSTGDWYFGLYLVAGVLVQIYFCELNAQVSGEPDWIPVQVLIVATIVWSAVHAICRLTRRAHGIQQHSYDPGIGILDGWLPGWPPSFADSLSNVAVALMMGCTCHLLNSPILGRWYVAIGAWLVGTDCFLAARHRVRRQRMVDAQAEAEYLSQQVQRKS